MRCLNDCNGGDKVCGRVEKEVLEHFKDNLVGVMMGIAYGGDCERLANIWGEKGTIYGYDTFEGHPKQLAVNKDHFEATCMDFWYKQYGMDELTYEFQRKELDRLGMTNVKLVKGLVGVDSCSDLERIHYAFLDMDILKSMQDGFEAVKYKLVPEGIIIMHDVNNIDLLIKWWNEVVSKDPMFEVMEYGNGLTGILKKK